VVVDIGTGDGRAVVARAAADPCALVIGVDAAAGGMAELSRRAARRGPANAMFLAAGVESLGSSPLACRADLVTVAFPWGSLLRGVLGLDRAALAGVASIAAPGGRLEALVSVVPSDGVEGVDALDASCEPVIGAAWAEVGLELVAMRPATAEEITASGSSWARRLRAGRDVRPVWRMELRRPTPTTRAGALR
jgi:16S rRNA (adenine(1408)-N(1))-methyltransferase